MGIGSAWHWLIVLVIVLLIFGTKKLRNIGSDLGGAVKGFKDSMKEGASAAEEGAEADTAKLENTYEKAAETEAVKKNEEA